MSTKRWKWIPRKVSGVKGFNFNSFYNGLFGGSGTSFFGVVKNLLNAYAHTGMTDEAKETADYEDAIADENATVAYMRQKEFQEQYLTPEAQLKSQAAGYDALGINRMMLGGSQPGASASTAPMSSGGNASVAAGGLDLVSTLISAALKNRQLDIDEGHLANETKRTDAEVEGIDISNANLQDLIDLQKGELDKKIEFMGQQIQTEPVKRALLRTEIGLKQAETAVRENMSALQKIDLKYHDAYQAAQLSIAQAYAGIAETDNKFHQKLLEQQIGINAKQIEIMNQTIVTGKLQNGLLAKQFQYYDSDRKFNRWTTGIGTAAKVVGAVAGVAMGGAAIGKLAPIKTIMHNGNPVTDYYGAYEGLPGM